MWSPKSLFLFVSHFFFVGTEEQICFVFEEEIFLTVSAGDNITLRCFEKTGGWWSEDPFVPSRFQRDDYAIQRRQLDEQLKLGKEEVILYNITYAYMGIIHCFAIIPSYRGCRTKTYVLYVRDENILSLVSNQKVFDTYYYDEHNYDKYIHCIPTEPNVTVEIFIGTSIDPESQEKVGDNDCLKPWYGFAVYGNIGNNPKLCDTEFNLDGEYFFTCKFRRNSKENSLTGRIIVTSSRFSIPTHSLSRVNISNQNIIGERLLLRCDVDTEYTGKNVTIEWVTPQNNNTDGHVKYFSKKVKSKTISGLLISEMNVLDTGTYYCIGKYGDHFSPRYIFITTHRVRRILTRGNTETDLFSARGVTVKWHVSLNGDPEHYFYWLKDGNPLPIEHYFSKIFTNFSTSEATLLITNVSKTDFGEYTLVASKNGKISEKLNINFPYWAFSEVTQTVAVIDLEKGLIKCMVVDVSSKYDVNWQFGTMSFWEQIEKFVLPKFAPLEESFSETNGVQETSYLTINSSWQGILECVAKSKSSKFKNHRIQHHIIGKNIQFQLFAIKNNPRERIEIFDTSDDGELRLDNDLGQHLILVCSVSASNFSKNIKWFYNDKLIDKSFDDDNVKQHIQHDVNAVYTYWKILNKGFMTNTESGYYKCESLTKSGISHSQTIKITVGEKYSSPNITETNMEADMETSLHSKFRLYCQVTGYPTPSVLWLKDNITLQMTDTIKFMNYSQTLLFENFTKDDVGLYKCEVFNSEGTDFKEINIKLTSTWLRYVWYILSTILLALVLISIFTVIKVRNEKNLQEKLKQIGFDNFETGDSNKLNPELLLSEQADLLPYDRSWEVSIKRIKLGKKLGSGAFGMVLKGEMEDINGKNIPVTKKIY